MPITTVTSFEGDIQAGYAAPWPPADLTANWQDGTLGKAGKMIANINVRVPDESAYVARLATPAITEFAGVLDGAYVSKRQVPNAVSLAKRVAKLNAGYAKWRAGLDAMFATEGGVTAKRFKDTIISKTDNWAKNFAAFGMPFVGAKKLSTGKGPAIFIGMFLTNDRRALTIIPAGWTIGTPTDICLPGQENRYLALLTGLLTQMMQFAVVSNFDAAVLTIANDKLVQGFNALNDLTKANVFASPDAPPKSSCILSSGGGAGILHVKAVIRIGAP
jgi:hypothetical protein